MTSPADRIRATIQEAHDGIVDAYVLASMLEALLPVVEERAITNHDQACALMMEYKRACRCGKAEAEQALLTAASALGAEDE